MDENQPSPPPPYPGEGSLQGSRWKVRNTMYRSNFTTNGEPSLIDFRERLEYLRESMNGYTLGAGSPADIPHIVEVQYSQAFTFVEHFVGEYEACLRQIKPLSEQDMLFLLLRRYAASSGASVYTEIRHNSDIQVFDSSVSEPLHTDSVAEHLVYGSGVVHSEISLETLHKPEAPPAIRNGISLKNSGEAQASPNTPSPGASLHEHHEFPLQTSHGVEISGSVTLNFPAIFPVSQPHEESTRSGNAPPVYQNSKGYTTNPLIDWTQIPEKFYAPAFRVHMCHHRGIERSVENSIVELPFGFPELVHHMHNTPSNVYHSGFYIGDKAMRSLPRSQGGFTAFECYIIPSDVHVYITIERDGDSLIYNCYRDKEVWELSHEYHEQCSGCS